MKNRHSSRLRLLLIVLVGWAQWDGPSAQAQQCINPGQCYNFFAPEGTLPYDPMTGQGMGVFTVDAEENPTNPGFPNNTVGFSIAVSHDSDYLMALDVSPAPLLAVMNNGVGPFFFNETLYNTPPVAGITVGATTNPIAFAEYQPLFREAGKSGMEG